MTIKLIQLKCFCTLMQDPSYSVTKTADRLHIDYTALSRHISSLEKELEIKLFDRTEHKKLKPTKEGWDFYNESVVKYQGIENLINKGLD